MHSHRRLKSVYCLQWDFLVHGELRKMNAAIRLTQKQCLIVNAILLIPNDAIFIKKNMKKRIQKMEKKLTWKEK